MSKQPSTGSRKNQTNRPSEYISELEIRRPAMCRASLPRSGDNLRNEDFNMLNASSAGLEWGPNDEHKEVDSSDKGRICFVTLCSAA